MAARLNIVAKARKSPGKCGQCGAVIAAGEKYFWWEFYRRPKSLRCALHPPAAHEREGNEKRAALMQAETALSDAREADTPDVGDTFVAVDEPTYLYQLSENEESNRTAIDAYHGIADGQPDA